MAKKKTILDLIEMKEKGEKAAWMVLYDSCFASYAEEAGMDMILVGDSMGMIVYGFDGTVPVTMEMSISVSGSHFNRGNSLGHTSQGKGGGVIIVYISCFYKRGDSEFFKLR